MLRFLFSFPQIWENFVKIENNYPLKIPIGQNFVFTMDLNAKKKIRNNKIK